MDSLVEKLDIISTNTQPKNGFDIIISGNGSRYRNNFTPPLRLEGEWGLTLQKIATYNSIANINNENNNLKYYNGTVWKTITIGTGSYEISELNDEIIRLMKVNGDYDTINDRPNIKLQPNLSRLTTEVYLENNYQIDFNIPNGLHEVLGFNKTDVISSKYNESPNPINIINVNSVLVHANIVKSSYYNGVQGNVIYMFPINSSPGYRMISEPLVQRTHKIEQNTISNLEVWLTDDNGLPLDNRNELVTINLWFQKL